MTETKEGREKKNVCSFRHLKSPRPLSPSWGPCTPSSLRAQDSLSSYLRINSLISSCSFGDMAGQIFLLFCGRPHPSDKVHCSLHGTKDDFSCLCLKSLFRFNNARACFLFLAPLQQLLSRKSSSLRWFTCWLPSSGTPASQLFLPLLLPRLTWLWYEQKNCLKSRGPDL